MIYSLKPGFSRVALTVFLSTLCAVSQAQMTLSLSGFEPSGTSSAGSITFTGIVGQPEGSSQSQAGFARLLHGAVLPGVIPPADPTTIDFDVQDMGDNSTPRLTWATSVEMDILGFDVYRVVDSGAGPVPGERLTPSPVLPTGTPSSGAAYEYFDPAVFTYGEGDRTYLLAVINDLGSATLFGVVLLADPEITEVPDWQILNH